MITVTPSHTAKTLFRSNRRRGHAASKNAACSRAVPVDPDVPLSHSAIVFADRFFSPARPHRLRVAGMDTSGALLSGLARYSRRADCSRRDQRQAKTWPGPVVTVSAGVVLR